MGTAQRDVPFYGLHTQLSIETIETGFPCTLTIEKVLGRAGGHLFDILA